MIESWAWDIEILPNFFSVVFVKITSYLKVFEDSCEISIKKGKEIRTPIPLVQKYTVKEIKEKLDSVEKKSFYITDTDDSQLLQLLGFINSLNPHYNENGVPIRTDVFGYNSTAYDKLMLAGFLMYQGMTNSTKELIKKLYMLSKHIIDIQDNPELKKNDPILNNLYRFKMPFINIDVMTLFALNKAGSGIDKNGNKIYFPKSLKQTSINLQWYELLEHELPPITYKDIDYYRNESNYKDFSLSQLNAYISKWDRYIIPEWIDDIMHYNTNDVYIVCEMIRLFIDEIRLRYNVTNTYKLDVLSSSRSNIADKFFIKFYSEFSNLEPYMWRGKKTERTAMKLDKVIFPFIKFKTPKLQSLLTDMKELVLYSVGKDGLDNALYKAYESNKLHSDLKDNVAKIYNLRQQQSKKGNPTAALNGISLNINNLEYTIATGGLHSRDIPRELKSKIIYIDENADKKDNWDNFSDQSYIYRHWDIASFYPSIMIVYSIAPEHLDKLSFVRLVKWLKDTRIEAKHSTEDLIDGIPKDILAQVLKIVINSIYGKFGFEKGDLYDRLATLKVTINGQLMILMLCEELELNGIEVVSANTDGIVVKLYKNKLETFNKIAEDWKTLTKLDADSEDYKCYINRDINNYICQELNNKITYKGALNPKMYLADLTKGYDMPIVAEAVNQFFINGIAPLETLYKAKNILDFCKTQNIARNFEVEYDNEGKITKQQRNIRFYVSNVGGTLYKVDKNAHVRNNLCAGYKTTILNTLDDTDIGLRNICFQYYLDECNKIIDPIKLQISPGQKADNVKKIASGKQVINKYSGMYYSLFDD